MKITVKFQRDKVWDKLYLPIYSAAKRNKWRWETIGAGVLLLGGFFSPIIGTILNLVVLSPQWSERKPILNKISIFFYVITIPLFFGGAHFLDLLEKKDKELQQKEMASQNRNEEVEKNLKTEPEKTFKEI